MVGTQYSPANIRPFQKFHEDVDRHASTVGPRPTLRRQWSFEEGAEDIITISPRSASVRGLVQPEEVHTPELVPELVQDPQHLQQEEQQGYHKEIQQVYEEQEYQQEYLQDDEQGHTQLYQQDSKHIYYHDSQQSYGHLEHSQQEHLQFYQHDFQQGHQGDHLQIHQQKYQQEDQLEYQLEYQQEDQQGYQQEYQQEYPQAYQQEYPQAYQQAYQPEDSRTNFEYGFQNPRNSGLILIPQPVQTQRPVSKVDLNHTFTKYQKRMIGEGIIAKPKEPSNRLSRAIGIGRNTSKDRLTQPDPLATQPEPAAPAAPVVAPEPTTMNLSNVGRPCRPRNLQPGVNAVNRSSFTPDSANTYSTYFPNDTEVTTDRRHPPSLMPGASYMPQASWPSQFNVNDVVAHVENRFGSNMADSHTAAHAHAHEDKDELLTLGLQVKLSKNTGRVHSMGLFQELVTPRPLPPIPQPSQLKASPQRASLQQRKRIPTLPRYYANQQGSTYNGHDSYHPANGSGSSSATSLAHAEPLTRSNTLPLIPTVAQQIEQQLSSAEPPFGVGAANGKVDVAPAIDTGSYCVHGRPVRPGLPECARCVERTMSRRKRMSVWFKRVGGNLGAR